MGACCEGLLVGGGVAGAPAVGACCGGLLWGPAVGGLG